MRAAWLPSRGRLPPSRGQHVHRAGRGPRDAHSRAMPRCCAQSRQEPWSFRLLPQPLPGRGACPVRKVRVSLRGSATGREAPVRHVLLSLCESGAVPCCGFSWSAGWKCAVGTVAFEQTSRVTEVRGSVLRCRSLILWFGAGRLSEPPLPHGPRCGLAWVGVFPDQGSAERRCCIRAESAPCSPELGNRQAAVQRFSLRAFSEPLSVCAASGSPRGECIVENFQT